jgi:hypothetical protein
MPTVEKFPRSHKFTIGDRIEIAALDVLEMLIEATYTRDRLQHLQQANLGIEKLRFLLRLAADLKLLDRRRYEHAARALDETGLDEQEVYARAEIADQSAAFPPSFLSRWLPCTW